MEAALNAIHDSPDVFFTSGGKNTLKFTHSAAVRICLSAASLGYVVARVEGGIWHQPGFEARGDCIWDGAEPPIDVVAAQANNVDAADFIRKEAQVHNAFVLTAPPLSGWPYHRDAKQ